jgi:hypothetical protein
MRLPCPGARTGVFFMHTLPAPAPRKRSPPPSWVDSGPGSAPLKSSGEDLGNHLQVSVLSHLRPSPADSFDRLFVAHFIASFGNLRPPPSSMPTTIWLDELPLLIASPRHSLAKHAIRAGSMLLYGTHACDVSIQTEARR